MLRRSIADSLRLKVLAFVLLGFAVVAVPSFFAFQWIVNSTVVQLGTLFAEKQVLYDRHRGLGTLIREVSLAETLSGSQAIRDWAQAEDDPDRRRRGIAELEHYRRYFADGSYFFVVAASGNYYFNDASNGYAGNQLRYTLSPENPDDAWYYSTIELGQGCHLNVNNDAVLRVTKVWMNCVIREGHTVLGVLGTGIDLTSFIQEVVNIPQNGVISMFVDRQGMIQAHRDRDLVNLASLANDIDNRRSVFSLLDGAGDEATLRRLMDDVTAGDVLADSDFVTTSGKATLVGVGYLDQLGWYNVTFMDLDTIIDRRLFLPIGLLLAAMMGLIAVVLMLVFKKQVLDRLVRLEAALHSARAGDYAPAMAISSRSQDEIGRLSTALADMARNVDDNTRLLESRVSERTRDLENLAFRDGLTGLFNRRGFAAAHAHAARRGAYGILLVDIDNFKPINDSHGHATGDAVVVEVANRILLSLAEGASCARWGGDEFIVLLPDCGPKDLRAAATQVLAAFAAKSIRVDGKRDIAVTVSIGAALARQGDSIETATEMADAALYIAKDKGRDRLVVFEPDAGKPSAHSA